MHRIIVNWFYKLLPAAIYSIVLVLYPHSIHAQNFRVTLSDNLLVLDNQNRSSTVDMVNMSDDPMEFTMTVANEFNGIGADGIPLVRWQPARAMVPTGQSVALRVASRLRADLPAGEYEFRVGAKSITQRPPITLIPSDTPGGEPGMSMIGIVMPELPITVYLRHNIDKPSVQVRPFVSTPDDLVYSGYFPLVKKDPAVSFVGIGQIVRKDTQAEVVSSRIHLTPRQAEGRFNLPRSAKPGMASIVGNATCLRIWSEYPARSKHTQELCG
jgi:hypothetical protein